MKTFLTILLFLATLAANAAGYYISSSAGSNGNGGTSPAQAWQTLSRLNMASLQPGDSVYLNRGDSWHEQLPVTVSGLSTGRITFSAYGTGAAPQVTGFVSPGSWTSVGTNLWRASVDAGNDLNVVTVGGVMTMRGRFPNRDQFDSGWLKITGRGGTGYEYSRILDSTYPTIAGTFPGAWVTMRGTDFQINTFSITSQTISGNTTTINYNGTSDSIFEAPRLGNGYFFQNSLAFLDQQNEWYYDTTARTITMYSMVNPSSLDVKVATMSKLIETDRSYITIDGIDFKGANYSVIGWQGGTGDSIKNSTIRYAGVFGVEWYYQTSCGIKNSWIQDANRTGVILILSNGSSITNSTVRDIALLRGLGARHNNGNQSGQGVFLNGPNVAARYNRVISTGYAGISATQDGVYVEYNFIDSTNMRTDDAGGVYYSDGSINGLYRYIRWNTILHTLGNPEGTGRAKYVLNAHAIYLDEHSQDAVIRYNTVIGSGERAVLIHCSRNVDIQYNLFYDYNQFAIALISDATQPNYHVRGMVIKHNSFFPTSGRSSREAYPTGWMHLTTDSAMSDLLAFGIADSNYYSFPFADMQQDGFKTTIFSATSPMDSSYTLPVWRSYFGQDQHSTVSPIRYKPYTISNKGMNSYPKGDFADMGDVLNYTGSTTPISQDLHKMDGPCFRMDYTGSNPTAEGMQPWFYSSSNASDYPAPSGSTVYVVELDGRTNSDREADFGGYIRATGSAESKVIYFKLASDPRHITLVFDSSTVDHTLVGHYFALFTQRAAQVGSTFWIDNLKVYQATITYANWRNFMDVKYAHDVPATIQTTKPYTDQRGVKAGQQFTLQPYSSMPLFTNPNLTRLQGVIRAGIR